MVPEFFASPKKSFVAVWWPVPVLLGVGILAAIHSRSRQPAVYDYVKARGGFVTFRGKCAYVELGPIDVVDPVQLNKELPSLLEKLQHATTCGLSLWSMYVDDEHLAAIGHFPHLVDLNLTYAQGFTSKGISTLRRIRSLTRLRLLGCNLSTDVIDGISKITSLKTLDLSHTTIDDATIDTLLQLPNLVEIRAYRTKVSAAKVDEVQRGRPGLRILIGEPPPPSS